MASTITFSNGAESVSIDTPQWGYKSDIVMPLYHSRHAGPTYGIYDDGTAYDVRILSMGRHLLTAADMALMNDFFSDATKGRGEDISLNLGTGSGFYPFGPDKGDSGVFTVRAIEYDQTGQLRKPWRYWDVGISLLMISAPSYALPSQVTDGNLQIGSITGIRYPQDGYNPSTLYDVKNVITLDSTAHEIDRSVGADRYDTEFLVEGNQTKIAALINYLVGTARGNNFTVIPGANNYMFGRDNSSTATYTVQMLNSKLSIMHPHYDKFAVSLKLNLVSVA